MIRVVADNTLWSSYEVISQQLSTEEKKEILFNFYNIH